MATKTSEALRTNEEAAGPRVQWDTTNLHTAYANVCAVNSTREEVVLNFGINKAWERSRNEMQIELTDRIILSPFAAQRLLDLLTRLMTEYESRYGKLGPTPAPTPAPTAAPPQGKQ